MPDETRYYQVRYNADDSLPKRARGLEIIKAYQLTMGPGEHMQDIQAILEVIYWLQCLARQEAAGTVDTNHGRPVGSVEKEPLVLTGPRQISLED